MLPTQQHDIAGRPPLDEVTLYRRRERTILVLATAYVIAAILVPFTATAQIFPLSDELELSIDARLPAGALALPIALIAGTLACELFGARRARGLVIAGAFASLAALGAGAIVDRDAFDASYPFAVASLVFGIFVVEIFAARRGRLLAAFAGTLGAWGAYAAITSDLPIAITAATYTFAAAIVGSIVARVARAALVILLRTQPGRAAPAQIVEETLEKRRRPFSTAEVAFFEAGDQIG